MNKIRYSFVLLAFSVFGGLQARADVITFNPNGGGGPSYTGVNAFNWAAGNSLAQGAISGGAPSSSFTLYYQATLRTLSDLGNNTITTLGAGGNNQITVVAGFSESLLGVSTVGPVTTASFQLASSPAVNFVNIYSGTPGTANNSAGTGFVTGAPILSAIVTTDFGSFSDDLTATPVNLNQVPGNTNYAGVKTVTGPGGAPAGGQINIEALITSVNSAYFPTLDPNTQVDLTFTDSDNNLPFRTVPPSLLVGGQAPNPGAINGISGPDFMFQSTANTTFSATSAVPEPSTMVLTLIGFGGMALARIRRRRAKVD